MMYLDVWNCKVAFWIQETLPRLYDVKHSVVLQSSFAISSALTYLLFSRNVPLLHMSRYVIAHDSNLPGQVTNAGVRRPGYRARAVPICYLKLLLSLLRHLPSTSWRSKAKCTFKWIRMLCLTSFQFTVHTPESSFDKDPLNVHFCCSSDLWPLTCLLILWFMCYEPFFLYWNLMSSI